MTGYDFDSVVERRGTGSFKWDRYKGRDVIPLWVADMDFGSPPAVIEALHERVDHGVFGYTHASDELEADGRRLARTGLLVGGRRSPGWCGCPAWCRV